MGETKRRGAAPGAYRPLDAAWRSLAEMAIPLDAPDRQRQEMRRAFYAGAQAFFVALLQDLDPCKGVTGADESRLQSISDEINGFARDVIAGRA
jgi:hypothetical protein